MDEDNTKKDVRKKDLTIFDKGNFLPENFDKILKSIRASPENRLKKFGIIK